MDVSQVRIIQYFDGTKQSIIPLFQRPYSWEKRHWTDLWNDLMEQYEEAHRSMHFMGAIVTVPMKSVPVGVAKHLVIDGQQRLTSLAILLVAIRDRAKEDGDNSTEGIIDDMLANRHFKDPDDLKLVPTQSDRAVYRALIQGNDLDQYEESRVLRAYKFFQEKLKGNDVNDQPVTSEKTLQAIQHSLQVVMINLADTDDPYLIFESLNHKGQPLSQADLVRNYVLMKFHHSTDDVGEQKEIYENLWRPMEKALESHMTEFLRFYGMRDGRNIRQNEIYTASKTRLAELDDKGVREELERMQRAVRIYEKFLNPDKESEKEIAKTLGTMQQLKTTVFYPLLIRFYRELEQRAMDEASLVKCLKIIESFHVRRLVCSVPTNALNKITLELCSGFPEENHDTWIQARLFEGSGGRRWPTDKEFSESLVGHHLYPRRQLTHYILCSLEKCHGMKEPVDTSTATIEHIMPQTLSDEWQDCQDIHEQWLNTLGNLTLTGYNPELGNLPFEEKKNKLRKRHTRYALSYDILDAQSWKGPQIEQRGRRLADLALQRWPR